MWFGILRHPARSGPCAPLNRLLFSWITSMLDTEQIPYVFFNSTLEDIEFGALVRFSFDPCSSIVVV